MSEPTTVICTYRVQNGKEAAFESLLKEHWPTLRNLNLATADPTQIYRGKDEGGTYYVEIFTWVDAQAPTEAHNTPAVMKVWEAMGALVEARNGRPAMEFPHVEPMNLN